MTFICYEVFPVTLASQHAVLAHALDHLASLSAYDLAIRAVLEPEWREILRWRSPKPAGCLQSLPLVQSRKAWYNNGVEQ